MGEQNSFTATKTYNACQHLGLIRLLVKLPKVGPEETISPPAAVAGTVSCGHTYMLPAHGVSPSLLLSSVTLA